MNGLSMAQMTPMGLLNTVIGWLLVLMAVVILLLAIVTLRQVSLMNRVVNVPVGGWFTAIAWGFFVVAMVVTAFSVLLI